MRTGTRQDFKCPCTPAQVFLTASATLREQVALSFRKLQTASLGPEAAAATAAAVAAAELHTFKSVPPAVFPLFLTTKQYLHMLDGTLADPFFPRYVPAIVLHVTTMRCKTHERASG
jgi:hypothetical protein